MSLISAGSISLDSAFKKTKTQKLIRKNEKLTEARKMVKRNGKVFL
jgi:hypothetical protein